MEAEPWQLEIVNIYNFEFLTFWNVVFFFFEILRFWNCVFCYVFWKFDMLKEHIQFRVFSILNVQNWNFEKLNICKFEMFESFEI